MRSTKRLAFVGASVAVTLLAGTGIGVALASPGDHPASYGTIPDAAYDSQGGIDLNLVPDYVLALDRAGNPAGYVAKTELFAVPNGNGQAVVDRDGRTVGRMVPGYGFVPTGQSVDSMTPYSVSVGPAPTG